MEITTVLSDYMRYIFQDSKKQRDVEEELEHIEAYIRIQKLRYGKKPFPLKRRWTVISENGRFRLSCCRHWWKTPWYTVYPWIGRVRFPVSDK